MEGEKGVEVDDGGAKKPEFLGLKLQKGLSAGKRGGTLTPVPSWKMEEAAGPSTSSMSAKAAAKPTARQLGASLWEIQGVLDQPKKMMIKRRERVPQLGHLSDSSQPNSPIKIQSASRLTRHIAASFDRKGKSVERTIMDLVPESPSSYNSSTQVSALNHTIAPNNSFDLEGKLKESGYTIKTSTELLKVFNRIWSLEEQLASNVSLVKTLKVELHHAHSRIRELVQEQQAYHHEMDDLMKRVLEDRVTKKNKERDRIKAAVQSIKNELEDEKKLRWRSESLHRKLAKELSEMKSAFMETRNDLKIERKSRALLEDLCDEFAKGIWEYQQETQNPKQKESLHHISKVWMEERLQMKMAEAHGEEVSKNKLLEKLIVEMTPFPFRRMDEKGKRLRRHSLESVHLNGAISEPQDANDDDSVDSDLQCFELNMEPKENVSETNFKQNGEVGMEKSRESLESNLTKENNSTRSHVTPVGEGSALNSGDSHNLSSLVSQLINRNDSDLDKSGFSSKMPQNVMENSLKGKLLEARLKGRNSRLRALRGSSGGLQQ